VLVWHPLSQTMHADASKCQP